jgi:hypothetical protein
MGVAGISMILASFSTGNIGGLVFLQGIMFGTSGSLIYLVSPIFSLLYRYSRALDGLLWFEAD